MADNNNRTLAATDSRILTSHWTGLADVLLAKFYPVKRLGGGSWGQSRDKREIAASDKFVVDDGIEVHCPISDGSQSMSLHWNSPFEGAGAESKIPTISALLQTGSINSSGNPLLNLISDDLKSATSDALAASFGRTGITKLNSTQVFTGMSPVKFQLTAHFRALIDPATEVDAPIQQFLEWAVPQYLANDGMVLNALKNGWRDGVINTVFPSLSPQLIAMKYGDKLYQPLVIDDISMPISGPMSSDGVLVQTTVQMTLSTLTAVDRQGIQGIYRGQRL